MMNSKLRDSKTRQIDDKNRSALDETIKIKKGFSRKTKENSKRNAREKGHKLIKMQPRGKRDPEQIGLVQTVWNSDTGKSKKYLVNPESIRETERVFRCINRISGG